MLRNLFHPFLTLLLVASSWFSITSHQNSQPITVTPPTSGATSGTPTAIPNQPSQPLPPPVAPAPLPDVDAMIVLDHSGSMRGIYCGSNAPLGPPATDAEELRVKAAQVVIAGLAADLEPRQTSLGIVTFGNTAELLRKLTPLSNDDSQVRDELSTAVENPPCLGDTNIGEAFQLAAQELKSERASAGNTPTIIFLTDGKNTVYETNVANTIRGIIQDLPGVQIFVVLLGSDVDQPFWQGQDQQYENMHLYALDNNDQMPDLYRDITAILNFTPEYANTPSLPPGQSVTLPMPHNVKLVAVTAIKQSPQVPLSITMPSGGDARSLPNDQFRALSSKSPVEVFVINRPEAGDWTFKVPDGEVVTILRPEFKSIYQVQLLQPDSAGMLSVDQPTDLTVQIVDVDTQQPLNGNFTLQGSYSLPDGSSVPLPGFQPATNNQHYTVQIPAGAFVEGQTYPFTLEVQDDQGLRSLPTNYNIAAGRLPILSISVPSNNYTNEDVEITARIANHDMIDGQPTIRVVNNIPGVTPATFRASDASTYRGTMTFERPGTYTLQAVLSGTTTLGRPFSSVRNFSIDVREPAWLVGVRNLATALALLLLLYFILCFGLIKWLIPLLQRFKIAPQGYMQVTAPGQKIPSAEYSITSLLVSKHKCFRLSVGVGSGFDICLEDDPNKLNDPDYIPPKLSLRERLFGKKPLGYVRVRNGDSVLETETFTLTFPKQGISSRDVELNMIEVSLESINS